MEAVIGEAVFRYLRWRVQRHLLRSPFLDSIEHLYRRLSRARNVILPVEMYGSKAGNPGQVARVSLATLTRKSATPPWKGRLLYDIVRQAKPKRILELGTHLGFGTLYLAAAAPHADIHTVEASPVLSEKARLHFRLLGIKPKVHVGLFEEVIPTLAGEWDILYIDGDHRATALQRYVSLLYDSIRPGGLIICDDIFWNWDMLNGWRVLTKSYPEKIYSVGPFGIVFK